MKDRIIDLTPSLHEMLQLYLKGKSPDGRVFNLSPNTISGIIRWAARKAGVDIHTHSLRHFFGQSLVDSGTDLETVRRLMGHSNLKTTQIYIGRTDTQRREAIARLEGTPINDTVKDEERIVLAESDLGLHLRVREVALIGSAKGTYLVLLRLTFVNSSSIGKTIYHIGSGAPGKQGVSNPIREYLEGTSKVRVTFSQNKQISVDLEKAEFLILPFDLPPYESRSYWMPLQIHQTLEDSIPPQAHLYLITEDISGKSLATFDDTIELKTYTVP
jgi:DNA-binding CsgD family transcriptional regulator